MACNKKITENLLWDCADAPKRGLFGGKAVIINYDDLDQSGITSSGATITSLALLTGTTGFSIEWYKELASTSTSFLPNSEDIDGYGHSFLARLSTSTAANAERANELKQGKFVVVVETMYGSGTDEAFKCYGFDNGMILSEMAGSSLENSGSLLFTLSSPESTVETYPFNIVLETDYTTTKTAFDALFG